MRENEKVSDNGVRKNASLNVKLGEYLRLNGKYSVGIIFIFICILFGNINV